ncbi:hypothetical protein [Micromonospora sp. AMSO31t]|uniref:hypothetical protein n=1 Tax=Micromonospora sp. AMSO31t TaxID=2650566 RepID=UPI00124B7E92|nr:hypothetical protein [Micromonospora sp. AMSO31t]KAB1910903.1 hypothetical protein F8274_19230 [Micromonospora sp. AMSO31t]
MAVNVARSRHRRRRVLDRLLLRIGPPPAVADRSPDHPALPGRPGDRLLLTWDGDGSVWSHFLLAS